MNKKNVQRIRLIDADALKAERKMADKCEDCTHDARMCQYNQDYTRMDICGMLDDAPTIDAIPVEWLKEHDYGDIRDSDGK